MEETRLDSSGSGWGPVSDYCGYVNGLSGFISRRMFKVAEQLLVSQDEFSSTESDRCYVTTPCSMLDEMTDKCEEVGGMRDQARSEESCPTAISFTTNPT
jgi:hypothetical protein